MKKCEDNWKRWGNWRDIRIKEDKKYKNNVVRFTQVHESLANTFYERKLKQKGKMFLPNTQFNSKLE